MDVGLPFPHFCSSNALPFVLKPVTDLRHREISHLCQLVLLSRSGVWIFGVRLIQNVPRLLLEAVGSLLAVPNGPWKGILPPYSILAHSSQGPATLSFCFNVMRCPPEALQSLVVLFRELVALEYAVQLLEVVLIKINHSFGDKNCLCGFGIVVYFRWQRPEKSRKAVYFPIILKKLAHFSDLPWRKWTRKHVSEELMEACSTLVLCL